LNILKSNDGEMNNEILLRPGARGKGLRIEYFKFLWGRYRI
jgi:hypothetical protein